MQFVVVANVIKWQKMGKYSGTFQENKEKAIHSWYPYLAGFSEEFVQEMIEKYNLDSDKKIIDPFAGVGTTLLVAKNNNISSVGIEINPFITFVANTKLCWTQNKEDLEYELSKLRKSTTSYSFSEIEIDTPILLKRAFSKKILFKLFFLKNKIYSIEDEKIRNLFLLTLISILKEVSNCKNFSPYLEFKSEKQDDADVFTIFFKKAQKMIIEISNIKNNTFAKVYTKDARNLGFLKDKYDLVVTSPPYLNNWDYSWITKLELFFLDYAKSEKELTEKLRNNLVKSSTYVLQNVKDSSLKIPASEVTNKIKAIVKKLENQRKIKGSSSKKYDIVVKEYFNDIYIILNELYKVLNKNAHCIWVVGDSGLYGIHIPTDKLIGEIGELVGFKFEGITVLRERKATRHKIKLQESIVILKK